MHSPTLFILAAILMGIMALVFQAVWRFNRDIPGLRAWTQAYALGFVFCVGFLWRPQAPGVLSVILAQGGILLMAYQCMRGCQAFVGRPGKAQPAVWALMAVWLMAAVYHTVVQPDLRIRLFLASVGPGVFFLLGAHAMWTHARGYPARLLFAGVCGVHGLFLLIRPVLFKVGVNHIEVISVVVLVESIVALNIIGFCILMLVNEHVTTALRRLAETDSLTGAFNHRTFLGFLGKVMGVEARLNRCPPVLLIDLDHFKQVNDTWGHQVGDEVLRHFVTVAGACLRQGDVLGRLGGEEFAVFLPLASEAEAVQVAERLRSQVATQPLQTSRGAIALSVSIGVAQGTPGESAEAVLVRADQAMYRAKAAGRNLVFTAERLSVAPA